MAYVEGQTVHDADSHIMELPGTILEFLPEAHHAAFRARANKTAEMTRWAEEVVAKQDDPAFRSGDAAELLLRKNHQALGAFRREDRVRALDLFGFASQLVFTTDALGNYGLERTIAGADDLALAHEAARAHNRMVADFCAPDRRLLATGYVPIVDVETAPVIAREAVELGCAGLVINSAPPATYSPSHVGLDPLWAFAQEAGVPILFHVGGETKMDAAYLENGLPRVKDFHGGDENFTGLSFMAIPLAVWQTLSALIFDGVFDRFPDLKFGAIELGASWVPSWLHFMDSGFDAFRRGEERLQKLSARPSEIARRQLRVTPYPHEPSGWIIANAGEEMLLFSSDFPHVEGGRNPIKRFEDNLGDASASARRRFYRDNFVDLMGPALPPDLRDHPSAAA